MGRIQSAGIALIADDDEYFRMALSTILRQKLGFAKVHEVSSFDEALECLETAGTIKLSIFDLSMPGIDSPLMLRTIRESFDVERLAVVSASERRSDIIASLEAGAHGFVSKSQGVNELSSALKKIYDGLIYVPQRLADLSPGMEEEAEPWDPPSAASDSQLPHLTPRQRDVLELLVEGRSNKEIARMLDLGPGTIKVHLAALFRNLGVSNRAAAAVAGARLLERLPNGHEPGRLPRTA